MSNPRIVSVNTMVKQIAGLTDDDVTAWERSFIISIVERTRDGVECSGLTERQLEVIERIFLKHFA